MSLKAYSSSILCILNYKYFYTLESWRTFTIMVRKVKKYQEFVFSLTQEQQAIWSRLLIWIRELGI